MKKYSLIFILLVGILFLILLNFREIRNYELKSIDSKVDFKILVKGVKGAEDFALGDEGEIYIGFKDRIQCIKKDGKSQIIYKDKSLSISSLEFYNKSLYFTSDYYLISFNLNNKKTEKLISNIPNFGDYNRSIIKIKDNNIYITVGAGTNSGVVGEDNIWKNLFPNYFDFSPRNITLNGTNYGIKEQGPFLPYGYKSIKGQVIPVHRPGNSEILLYGINNGKLLDFATGIRNVTGFDFNSKGIIIASIGGIEDRGSRPVYGDKDYLYYINKGVWYGFPDYSGGDPLDSPRFYKDGEGVNSLILDNPPSKNPPSPIYQHRDIKSIGAIGVDAFSVLGSKDSIYFYDKLGNNIYRLSQEGILYNYIKFSESSNIVSLKFSKDSLLILDKEKGIIYDIKKK